MAQLTIELTEEQMSQLKQRAAESGVQPENQLQAEVSALFDARRQRLQNMIRAIVQENRVLYERLA